MTLTMTQMPHLKKTLMYRYLNFMKSIERLTKSYLSILLNVAKKDVISVTGGNLWHIMLLCRKNSVDDLCPTDATDIQYHDPPAGAVFGGG